MGLATIDPHSHKVQTKLYKIPKFGVNRPKSKQDTVIWKCHGLKPGNVPASIASTTSAKQRGGYKVFPIVFSILHVVAWNKFGGVVMSCDLHVRNRTIDKLVFSVWIPPWSRCCLSWLYRSCFGKVSIYFCAWFSVCVFVFEHKFSFARRLIFFFVGAKSRSESL